MRNIRDEKFNEQATNRNEQIILHQTLPNALYLPPPSPLSFYKANRNNDATFNDLYFVRSGCFSDVNVNCQHRTAVINKWPYTC